MKKISSKTIEFFADAIENSKNIPEIVNNPSKSVDKKILTKSLQADIEAIKSQRNVVFDVQDAQLEQEIVSFVNAVLIRGGKYLNNWYKEPNKIAKELGFRLSADAEMAIKKIDFANISETIKLANGGSNNQFIAIVIIIVIVLIPANAKQKSSLVIDYSGKQKI